MAKRKKKSALGKKKKSKAFKKSSTMKRSAMKKSSPRRAPSAGKTYPVICRECFYEYELPANLDGNINCNVCGHSCAMPESDFFSKFEVYQSKSKTSLMLGIICGVIIVVCFFAWMFLLQNPENVKNSAINYGIPFVMFISYVVAIIQASNYEKNIYRAYF